MATIICKGSNVLLPDTDILQPATIFIDADSGKIIEVHPGQLLSGDSLPPTNARLIDAGENVLLPGLVEYVKVSLTARSMFIFT